MGGRKRGRETRPSPTGTRPATQACDLTGNRTGYPLVYSLALNPLSHTSQGSQGFLMEVLREAGLRLGSRVVMMGEGEVVRKSETAEKAKGSSLEGCGSVVPPGPRCAYRGKSTF